jgi:hypothetical protein
MIPSPDFCWVDRGPRSHCPLPLKHSPRQALAIAAYYVAGVGTRSRDPRKTLHWSVANGDENLGEKFVTVTQLHYSRQHRHKITQVRGDRYAIVSYTTSP